MFYQTRDLIRSIDDALREVREMMSRIDRYRRPHAWWPLATREAKLQELREALVDLEEEIGRTILLDVGDGGPLKRRHSELLARIKEVLGP